MGTTYVQVLRVFPDLTLLHVVLLRILEALLEVSLHLVKERVAAPVQPTFDVVQGNWTLDLLIVVGILPFGGQAEEVERQLAVAAGRTGTTMANNALGERGGRTEGKVGDEVGLLPNCCKRMSQRLVTHSLSLASLIVCQSFSPLSFTCSGSSPAFSFSPASAPALVAVPSAAPVAFAAKDAPVFCRLARGASTSTPCAANILASRFDMTIRVARSGRMAGNFQGIDGGGCSGICD